ncbi:MAG: hypothetical protein K2W85_11000 [Phycisphaerales bacterium]|nr:hypothetical protein [Phycisphaerales bacterium]
MANSPRTVNGGVAGGRSAAVAVMSEEMMPPVTWPVLGSVTPPASMRKTLPTSIRPVMFWLAAITSVVAC